MAKELELKYYANAEVFHSVLSEFPGKSQEIQMQTTYFDTKDSTFSARKMTLRQRLENGISVCTLKTPLPGNVRGEWEVAAADIESAIPLLLKEGAPEELQTLAGEGLIPICGAKFLRQAIPLSEKDFSAEIALDRGVLLGGGKEAPFCELEIEHKSGEEAAFLAYCAAFAARYRLTECKKSKFRRAYLLRLGE